MLREEESPGRGVTLQLQPERVCCLSQVIDAESVRQGMLEGNDGRKGAGDDRLVIDVDEDGDEIVAIPFEEHRGLAEELREAKFLGEEKDEGVIPLARGLLEAIEGLPEPHAIASIIGRRDIACRRLHEATTIVWKGGVQEGSVDVKGVAHHGSAVCDS